MCGMGRRVQDGERGNGDGNRRCLVLMLIGKERKLLSAAGNRERKLIFSYTSVSLGKVYYFVLWTSYSIPFSSSQNHILMSLLGLFGSRRDSAYSYWAHLFNQGQGSSRPLIWKERALGSWATLPVDIYSTFPRQSHSTRSYQHHCLSPSKLQHFPISSDHLHNSNHD